MPNRHAAILARRLHRDLRTLRGPRSALSVATALGWSETKLTRLETTSISPRPDTIATLLDHYQVDAATRKRILTFVADLHQPSPWDALRTVLQPGAATYLTLESASLNIRVCAPNEIPGLFRTPAYADAVLRRRVDLTDDDAHLYRELHQRRLHRLDSDDAPHMWAIIDEAALLRAVGDADVMRHQIQHLIHLATHPRIAIQIMRFRDGVQPGWVPFTIMDFADLDPETVCTETATGLLFVDGSQVADYRGAFERHLAAARPVPESVEILEKIHASWR